MFKKKKHPYEYITESNFDIIKSCLMNGMQGQKTPQQIAQDIVKMTDIPEEIATALVSEEVKGMGL